MLVSLAFGCLVTAKSGLQILYISYNTNQDEVVVIFNASPYSVDLIGYTLWSQGDQQFVFGETTLNPQPPVIAAFDVIRVHAKMCDVPQTARDFRWATKAGLCYRSNVWNDKGDQAKLYAQGNDNPISVYTYP